MTPPGPSWLEIHRPPLIQSMPCYAFVCASTKDEHTSARGSTFNRALTPLVSALRTHGRPSLQPAMRDPSRSLGCRLQGPLVPPACTQGAQQRLVKQYLQLLSRLLSWARYACKEVLHMH